MQRLQRCNLFGRTRKKEKAISVGAVVATEIRYAMGFIATDEERGRWWSFAFVTFLWGAVFCWVLGFGRSDGRRPFENPDIPGFFHKTEKLTTHPVDFFSFFTKKNEFFLVLPEVRK